MSKDDYVIRKMESNPAERQMLVTAYNKEHGEVTVLIPTSGMEADSLPAAILAAYRAKVEAAEAAEAD